MKTNKQAIFKIITPDVWRFLFMRKKPDLKTTYILRLLLFIGWIIVCIPSICQNAKKAFHCFLNDTEAYEKYAICKVTNSVGIDTIFTVYQIKVTDKSTGKLTEEYFRHDDSCYQFFAYDSSGKVIKRGLLQSYFTGLIDTSLLQIPDLDIDPYGTKGVFKDTILIDSIYKYRQAGKWKENDSTGYFWKGSYENGLKEGEWKRGTRFVFHHSTEALSKMYDYFKPFDYHFFEKGIELRVTGRKPLWPVIEGDWYYNLFKSQDSTIWYFSREPSVDSRSRSDWDFISQSEVKTYCIAKGEYHPSLSPVSWQYTEDTLSINYCQGKMDFEIIDFTPTYMILRRLPYGQSKLGF